MCWASIRTHATLVAKMRAIYFRWRRELGSQDIKDRGPCEHVFDRIVRNDDSNPNEDKMALFAQRCTKFIRKKQPFLGILQKGNSSSKMIVTMNLKLNFFKRT